MSLIVTITLTEATDCKTIPLTETTGVYDAVTNLGGYGSSQTPTNDRQIADIIEAYIRITPLGDEDYTQTILDSSDAQTLAGGTAYSSSMANLGGITGDLIPDSVYLYQLIQVFNGTSATTLSFTEDSSTVTASSSTVVAGISHIILDQGTDDRVILEVASIDGTTITLEEAYTGATAVKTGSQYAVGYMGSAYIGAKCQINNCLHEKIAELAVSDCGCSSSIAQDLALQIAMYFGIQANMDRTKYNKAQSIIDCLTLKCGDTDCGCS